MIVEILAIGTEVVDGDVLNSNAQWLSSQMSGHGFEVGFHSAIPDEEALILKGLQLAASRSQWVLVTGGLGPTIDDFTLEVTAKFFQRKLVPHQESLEKIRNFFKKIGRELTKNQEKQALLPEGSTVLANPVGTAPGAYFQYQGIHFAFFPGVPAEMHAMFQKEFLPILAQIQSPGKKIVRKTLRCFGLPEGQFDDLLRPMMKGRGEIEGVQIGFRVRIPTIDLRLKASHPDARIAQEKIDKVVSLIRERLGEYVFGEGEDSLEEVVGRLLKERGLTIATAESCTGGFLAHLITNIPGASDYFLEGVVSYSNESKIKLLGVQEKTLQQFGAVSAETALEMAQGVKRISGADFAISVTGIAGPTGGTPEKPVGTVHISVIHPGGEWEKAFYFPFGRERFKQVTAAAALDRIRRFLLSST